MKELEKHERDTEKQSVELQQIKEEKIEFKLVDQIRPEKGHKVWEIDTKQSTIKEASFKQEEVIDFNAAKDATDRGETIDSLIQKDIVVNPDCVYISALNSKNALKRYRNNKGSAIKPQGWLQL